MTYTEPVMANICDDVCNRLKRDADTAAGRRSALNELMGLINPLTDIKRWTGGLTDENRDALSNSFEAVSSGRYEAHRIVVEFNARPYYRGEEDDYWKVAGPIAQCLYHARLWSITVDPLEMN